MQIHSLKLAYFSPTGTTKTIAEHIARGINPSRLESIDITLPDARCSALKTSETDLLVVALPVYIGRLPAIVTDWLNRIQAHSTLAVCVVVYGNRAYEDALIELRDTLTKQGCIPIACAAYIGEHSFSSTETPIAAGRPDVADRDHAEAFGRKLAHKLLSATSTDDLREVTIPGNHPYRGNSKLWDVDFLVVGSTCTQCGLCASDCPVGAIHAQHSDRVDIVKCITCCACIKHCPQKARSVKPSPVKDVAIRLNKLFSERKQPEFFL
jgi:ferredoxin